MWAGELPGWVPCGRFHKFNSGALRKTLQWNPCTHLGQIPELRCRKDRAAGGAAAERAGCLCSWQWDLLFLARVFGSAFWGMPCCLKMLAVHVCSSSSVLPLGAGALCMFVYLKHALEGPVPGCEFALASCSGAMRVCHGCFCPYYTLPETRMAWLRISWYANFCWSALKQAN